MSEPGGTGRSQAEGIQQLAAVCLSSRIAAGWRKLSVAEQEATQAAVLHCLARAESRALLRAVTALANVVAQSSVLHLPWDGLLPALEEAARSPVANHREAAMDLLGQLTDSLGLRLQPHYPALQVSVMSPSPPNTSGLASGEATARGSTRPMAAVRVLEGHEELGLESGTVRGTQ